MEQKILFLWFLSIRKAVPQHLQYLMSLVEPAPRLFLLQKVATVFFEISRREAIFL